MASLDYDNPDNAPRTRAVYILDNDRAGSVTSDRGMGYALIAIYDALLCINDTLNELMVLMVEKP